MVSNTYNTVLGPTVFCACKLLHETRLDYYVGKMQVANKRRTYRTLILGCPVCTAGVSGEIQHQPLLRRVQHAHPQWRRHPDPSRVRPPPNHRHAETCRHRHFRGRHPHAGSADRNHRRRKRSERRWRALFRILPMEHGWRPTCRLHQELPRPRRVWPGHRQRHQLYLHLRSFSGPSDCIRNLCQNGPA